MPEPRRGRGRGRYSLVGLTVHLGDAYSGHYVAYVRREDSEPEGTWLCCSDCSVRQASLAEVLSAEAYMLFYQMF